MNSNPLQTQSNYDSRRSSMSSVASWANTQAQPGRLLYAPLILVNEAGGTQTIWSDTNGSTSLPAAARPGWHTNQGVPPSQRQQPYATLRVPSQHGPGYMEKGSADSLVESVSTAAVSVSVTAMSLWFVLHFLLHWTNMNEPYNFLILFLKFWYWYYFLRF